MNVAIKTRLDAIDAQMAELQKEQAKLREELDKPEFVPWWYLSWDGDEPTDKALGPSLDYAEDADDLASLLNSWEHSVPYREPEAKTILTDKTR